MAFRNHHHDEYVDSTDGYYADDPCAPVEFYAGDPVCPSTQIRRRRPVLRKLVIATLLIGSGYAWLNAPADLRQDIVSFVKTSAGELMVAINERRTATAKPLAKQHQTAAAPPPITETKEIAPIPGEMAGEAVDVPAPEEVGEEESAETTEADSDEAAAVVEEDPEPLPPPKVDPKDPYQKRAVAVGLHPDLSRAVLSRLTDADYRNAGIAIKRALAETPDTKTFTWPNKSAGGSLALFEVSFVRGSAPDCRRYVVVVTKNRWSSTALPMEKCGLKPPRVAAKAAG